MSDLLTELGNEHVKGILTEHLPLCLEESWMLTCSDENTLKVCLFLQFNGQR